jgi:hypothetical protein
MQCNSQAEQPKVYGTLDRFDGVRCLSSCDENRLQYSLNCHWKS